MKRSLSLFFARIGSKAVGDGQQPGSVPVEVLAQFAHYIRFVSCDPAKNRNRFYLLNWQPALDGSAVLISTWGRLGTRGRSQIIRYPEQAPVHEVIRRIIQRRLQRGYQVIEWQ